MFFVWFTDWHTVHFLLAKMSSEFHVQMYVKFISWQLSLVMHVTHAACVVQVPWLTLAKIGNSSTILVSRPKKLSTYVFGTDKAGYFGILLQTVWQGSIFTCTLWSKSKLYLYKTQCSTNTIDKLSIYKVSSYDIKCCLWLNPVSIRSCYCVDCLGLTRVSLRSGRDA